jgi:coproporphyrinogen III oxidase-like Fe-S oxidoreductase
MNQCQYCGCNEIFGNHVQDCAKKYLTSLITEIAQSRQDPKLHAAIADLGVVLPGPRNDDHFP